MPWKLARKPRFDRDLSGLAKREQDRIRKAVEAMVANPSRAHIVKLAGNLWRLRVGDWRIFFEMDNEAGIITALSVARRSSKTY